MSALWEQQYLSTNISCTNHFAYDCYPSHIHHNDVCSRQTAIIRCTTYPPLNPITLRWMEEILHQWIGGLSHYL